MRSIQLVALNKPLITQNTSVTSAFFLVQAKARTHWKRVVTHIRVMTHQLRITVPEDFQIQISLREVSF